MRKDVPEEPSPPEPNTDGSGETGPWGDLAEIPPGGGGAQTFSPSPPVGDGGRHDGAGDGDGNGHAQAAGASSQLEDRPGIKPSGARVA